MDDNTRRGLLRAGATAAAVSAAATAGAQTFGNPDRPLEARGNVTNPIAAEEPGPQNPALAKQFPSFQDTPATDINGMDLFWASFNNAHKRYQNGGWAREVTQGDFAISEAVSGVNMRLGPGGVRELHWHQRAEWAVMTDGKCGVTILDGDGRAAVRDVKRVISGTSRPACLIDLISATGTALSQRAAIGSRRSITSAIRTPTASHSATRSR
jgi:oxalate decarboxylase